MNPPQKLCLLVVDDEPEVCDSVYHLLRRQYTVLRANGAADAVKLMAEHEVDIIMTDQRMPDVTGVEMLQHIKCRHPEAVRILFTGYADIRSVISAINQGHVYRYLSKPWQPEELELAIADAASEFRRLADHHRDSSELHDRISSLEAELADARARISSLEAELAAIRSHPRTNDQE